jgi:hypothetical protein
MGNSLEKNAEIPKVSVKYHENAKLNDSGLICGLLVAIKYQKGVVADFNYWNKFIGAPEDFIFDNAVIKVHFRNESSNEEVINKFRESLHDSLLDGLTQTLVKRQTTQTISNLDEVLQKLTQKILTKLEKQEFLTCLANIIARRGYMTYNSHLPFYLSYSECIQDTYIKFTINGSVDFKVSSFKCELNTSFKLNIYMTDFKEACEKVIG